MTLATASAVDSSGNAYVAGATASSDFPTTRGAFQTTYGGNFDAFVSKLNKAGSALFYSTYLGGSDTDSANGVAVGVLGTVYITGNTDSSNFPTTPGAFQTTFRGAVDAFVSKFGFAADLFLRILPTPTTVHQGDLITYAFPVWNLGPDVAEGV